MKEGVHFREGTGELGGNLLLVDAGRREQRGHQVDVRGWCIDGASRRGVGADAGDHERHPSGLVVEVEPLLVKSSVRSEQVAVIGGAHQQRVVRTTLGDRSPHLVEWGVDLGVEPLVQVAVHLGVLAVEPLDGRRRPVSRRVGGAVSDLRGRLGGEILFGSCGRWHVRRVEG